MQSLSERIGEADISNVVVYVADSLRYDSVPPAVASKGLTARTIAASTYTATSVPSMMTGLYPSKHRVWNFDDVLPATPEVFSRPNSGTDLRSVWVDIDDPAEKPPNRILRLDENVALEEADEPFFVVVHEKGAHAPYDFFNVEWEKSPGYFEHYADKREQLPEEYRKGAVNAGERFLRIVEEVEERGLRDDTLFIFTSDHGELLGEPERGGLFAHGSPVCPELVHVPTVFIGPGLPEGEAYDRLASGVDLAPTVLGAQGRPVPDDVDGVDLWNEVPDRDRILRSEFWANGGRVKYGAGSAWNEDGGVVRHHGSAPERLLFAVHRKLIAGAQAPANRSLSPLKYWNLLKTYGPETVVYGDPDAERLEEECATAFEIERRESDVAAPSREQLEALGYVK